MIPEQENTFILDVTKPYSIFVLIVICITSYWIFYWVVRIFFITIVTRPENIKDIYFNEDFKLEVWIYQTLTFPYTKTISEI